MLINKMTNKSDNNQKTHSLFTIGLFAHIISILFIALYTTLDELDLELLDPLTMGFALEREILIHAITVVTLILLYVSFALKLTWTLRTDEALAILIIWGWLGNIIHGSLPVYTPCDGTIFGVTSASSSSSVSAQEHNHTINSTVIIASDVMNQNQPHVQQQTGLFHAYTTTTCGSSFYSVYFSILCLLSSIMSFLGDTRHYCLSFFFKTLSILTTILIFVIPIACNRFRFMGVPILILKLTLYNLAWNMNRFMVETQGNIINDYSKGVVIMQGYESVYRRFVTRARGPHYYTEKHAPRERVHGQGGLYREDGGYYDGQQGDEEEYDDTIEYDEYDDYDDDDEYEEEEDFDTEEDYEMYHATRHRRKNPSSVLQSLEKTNTVLKKVALPGRGGRGSSASSSSAVTGQQELQSRHEQQVPHQIAYFTKLHKINRRHKPSCFCSWKHRGGGEDRLSDIARTVWILALCPLYLFVAIIFIMVMWYYIRSNLLELDATRKTITAMEKIIK